mgnify:CR=1 FL=1
MFVSVIIPTYNRLGILIKCLNALENQIILDPIDKFEIIIVDDGSTDGTQSYLKKNEDIFSHVRLFEEEHKGPSHARNKGIKESRGNLIVFIDSDLVVKKDFLISHAKTISKSWTKRKDKLCFTYGSVVNTSNFDNPTSERIKPTDLSWAYFATGNVAIHKETLNMAGMFDNSFCLYGWEDLELGERLRKIGVKLIKCPNAIGYHWHPPLTLDQIPNLIRIEKERAKMGLVFYKKHPSLRVKAIIQYTYFHKFLWELLTIGGIINEKSLRPILQLLIKVGVPGVAMQLLRLPLNRIGVRAIFREAHVNRLY